QLDGHSVGVLLSGHQEERHDGAQRHGDTKRQRQNQAGPFSCSNHGEFPRRTGAEQRARIVQRRSPTGGSHFSSFFFSAAFSRTISISFVSPSGNLTFAAFVS